MKPLSKVRWFSTLAALEAGAAFYALWIVPHQGPGFSGFRLGMLGFFLLVMGLWVLLGRRADKWIESSADPSKGLACAFLVLALSGLLFLLRYLDPMHLLPLYQRLSPLLFYLLALAVQFSIMILILHRGPDREALMHRRPVLAAARTAFLFLLAALIFIGVTRVGLTPDKAYWGEPGVPVPGWQLGLALLAGLLILLLGLRYDVSQAHLWLAALLWLLAVAIWMAVPIAVMKNSFYMPIDPPSDQPFPASDAGYYDSMAHSLLIGYPYLGDIPTRPLYIVFLAALHLLLGERYDLIVAGQTLVLALIPVVLYFLGQKVHSRAAGVTIGLLAIGREWTSLLVSSETRVSNSKTLLVDLPTLLLLLLACLFALRWLERREWKSALIAGGAFGILFLLRTQSLLILPFLLLAAILTLGFKTAGRWQLHYVFFALGVAAAASPWLIHNYLQTGQFTFDAPSQYKVIASQYAYTGNLNIQAVDLQGKSLPQILLTFLVRDPRFVLGFIATHFFATQVSGLLALPLIQPYNGLFAPINLYWTTWDGTVEWYNLALIVVYLAVIAAGLGAAWKRLRWAGLMPLAFSLGYSLANGLGRFSGWRYSFPADWISYFYFGVGAMEILGTLAALFGGDVRRLFPPALKVNTRARWTEGVWIAACFALVGSLPWIAAGLAVPRYAGESFEASKRRMIESAAVRVLGIEQGQIESFSAQPSAVLQVGRLLYPRFYPRNQGMSSSNPWPAYQVRDYARLGFLLLNQARTEVVLATRARPGLVPNAAEVVVLGCRQGDYVEARLVYFMDTDTATISAPLTQPCAP